jgi:hypothetical protein
LPHRDLGGKKIRFGSEMCGMAHDLAAKLGKHSRRFIECSREALKPSALQRRGGAVDSRPGRLRQRKPQPLAPRPCACPARTSAPSRHSVTSAPAYHSSYLRNYHSFNNRSYLHSLLRIILRRWCRWSCPALLLSVSRFWYLNCQHLWYLFLESVCLALQVCQSVRHLPRDECTTPHSRTAPPPSHHLHRLF